MSFSFSNTTIETSLHSTTRVGLHFTFIHVSAPIRGLTDRPAEPRTQPHQHRVQLSQNFLYPGEMAGWRGQECRHCPIRLVLDRHQTSSEIIDQVIIFSFSSAPVQGLCPSLPPAACYHSPDSICSSLTRAQPPAPAEEIMRLN